ncbi:MAG: ABC transporter permease [Vicinamibacterales bacterium]
MAMNWAAYVRARLSLPGIAPERERDIVDELAAQLEATYDRARAAGAADDAAVAAALGEVPDWAALAAALKGVAGAAPRRVAATNDPPSPLVGLGDDLRDAVRGLTTWRALPAALVMLSLAIGAMLAAWAVFDAWIGRETGFARADRLVFVWPTNHTVGQPRDVVSGPTFLDWQRRTTSFTGLAAFNDGGLTIRRDGSADVFYTLAVTPEFFDVVGVPVRLGRTFVADDVNRAAGVVLISHGVWQREFAGDPSIVGRTLTALGQPHEVVGVLPEGFAMLGAPDVVTLLDPRALERESRSFYNYWTIGRLRDGRTRADAQRDLEAVMAALVAEYPGMRGWTATVTGYQSTLAEPVRLPAFVLLAVAALMLVVGLGNTAHLLACRALDGRRDSAIRAALGASPARLRRLRAIEGGLLAAAGGGLGLGLATGVLGLANTLAPTSAAIAGSAATVALPPLGLNGSAAGPAAMALAVIALLLGFGAAGHRSEAVAMTPLRATSPAGAARFTLGRRVLLGGQTAVATTLLSVAALLLILVVRLMATSPGFDPDRVVATQIGLIDDLDQAGRARYYTEVLRAAAAVPGVLDAGLNDYLPLTNEDDYEGVEIPGQARDGRPVTREEWRRVSAGYFRTMRIPLLRGRVFDDGDDERTASVAVVNEAFARKYWPDADPVGTRIRITSGPYGWSEVIGVVGDVREVGLDRPAKPMLFVPYHRAPRPVMGLFVRLRPGTDVPLAALRRAVWSVDPTRPIVDPTAMTRIVGDSYAVQRATLWGAGTLALLTWLLMLGGIYAIVGVIAAARTPEIAVRRALGAGSRQVLAAVMGAPCLAALAGTLVGLGGAVAAARLLAALVPGVPGFDPVVAGAVSAIVGVAVAVACVAPARRALAVDPLVAMRAE